MIIQTKPEPFCPKCGGRMRLIRPKPDKDFRPFWGYINYPGCKGTRNIDDEGKPEMESRPRDVVIYHYDDEGKK